MNLVCVDCGLRPSAGTSSCTRCGGLLGTVLDAHERSALARHRATVSPVSSAHASHVADATHAMAEGPRAFRSWLEAMAVPLDDGLLRPWASICRQGALDALRQDDRVRALGWARCVYRILHLCAQRSTKRPPASPDDETEGEDHAYRFELLLPAEELYAVLVEALGTIPKHPVLGADRAASRFLKAQRACWGDVTRAERAHARWMALEDDEDEDPPLRPRMKALRRWLDLLSSYVTRGWLAPGKELRRWLALRQISP